MTTDTPLSGRMLSDAPDVDAAATPPSQPEGRMFSLGQVLTLACANTEARQIFCSYAELLDVLGYMLNDVPLDDDIPAAIERCRPAVHRAHPDLAHLHPPKVGEPDTNVLAFIAAQEREHGRELWLRPLEEG